MKKISKRAARKRSNKLRRALIAAGCSSGVLGSGYLSAATLPVPCTAGSCTGKGGPSVWATSGNASATITADTLQVQQTTDHAILNWSSFNVSAGGHVVFKQPSSTSIALNRIFQGSPSAIFGSVTANGQLYLVNQNGFVFGSTSRVNVGGLLATSLGISDNTFNSGLLTPIQQQQPALTPDPVLGPDGQPLPIGIVVQQGAQITTNAAGQRILLAAPTVTNGGSISAPDGQAILASGQEVFLYTDPKSPIRGLLVEVDGGGKTINQVTGSISADRGNVTLIGLAVNQDGRVSATTSIAANGSIRLLARDTDPASVATEQGAAPTFGAQTGGTLELGPQSVTAALPDATDKSTSVNAVPQLLPTIELSGQQVTLTGGSHIVSPDGQLTITARANPAPGAAVDSRTPDNSRIRMDAGAVIDLSGSEATVPVTNNLVTVQLRGTELADDPLQRNGALRGQTVVVDARADGGNGTAFANVSGEIGLIQHNIFERTDKGGTVTFDSTGDIGIATGAVVNVSGGAVNYTGGLMQTSQLVKADGSTVDIGNANPNQSYSGIVNPTFKSVSNTWGVVSFIPTPGIAHYEAGYTQGASAGTVQFLAPSMVLNGTFMGQAINGPLQRTASTMAAGGQFIVGSPGAANNNIVDFRAPVVEFTNTTPNIAFADDASLPNPLVLQLPVGFMTNGGFTGVQITSNQRIIVPENTPLNIQPGGSLSLTAPRIDASSSVSAPSGHISLTTLNSDLADSSTTPGIYIGNGVRFDVSGLWTNDSLVPVGVQPTGTVLPNAGSILLSQSVPGGALEVGSGAQFSATGGAWLARSGALTAGNGGSISLLSDVSGGDLSSSLAFGNNVTVAAFGVQGALGGSLQIEAPRIDISSGDTTWLRAQSVSSDPASGSVLKLDSSLFSSFGFSSFDLIADGAGILSAGGKTVGNVLTVEPSSNIDLSTHTLVLNADAASHASGNSVTQFAHSVLLPSYKRTPSQLTLNASASNVKSFSCGDVVVDCVGGLLVGANAHITADPNPNSGSQSSVKLTSVGTLEFDGVADVPGGTVNLSIATPPASMTDPGFVPDLQLQLGATARIDVAGTTVYRPSDLGLLLGNVLPGGSVSLSAARGTITTDVGSLIDFSGTQALVDLQTTLPTPSDTRATVASAGGTLSVSAGESISLLGDLNGRAGTGTTGKAFGGTLNVTLGDGTATNVGAPFPASPLVIQLTSNGGQLEPSNANRAVLDPNKIAASGVDALTLDSVGSIELSAGVNLALARSIVLESPAIAVDAGAPVSVSAPYLALGAGLGSTQTAAAQPGSATVSFSGEQVDLAGNLSLQGVGSALISSTGDIQLLGAVLANSQNGSLSVGGDLTLSASRIVPGTAANFVINANLGAGNTVTFQQAGPATGIPLSVAGSLTVNARDIVQAGTIMAPFGTITLNASQSLTLAPGSLTSVSGNGGTLPYGLVENDTTWFYGFNSGTLNAVPGTPQRQIALNGGSVTLAKGSTVDISGGGDVYAYEWTPGTGGTKDALSAASNPNLYAIVPSLGSKFGPYDPLLYQGSNLAPGDSVYLSGGGGLAAGVYTLLPARYALLPGAYLVEAVPGFANLPSGANIAMANGGTVVAGYRTFADTGLGATQYSGFEILPGSYAHQLASYTDEYASAFFSGQGAATASTATAIPSLPADAGMLALAVDQSLDALGTILGKGAKGGRNATIAVSAPQLEIDPGVGVSQQSGDVHLSAAVIESWNPGRLFIGATPAPTAANTLPTVANSLPTGPNTYQVGADVVRVANGAALSADEIVLFAKQGIDIDSGASLKSSSASGGTAPSVVGLANPTPLNLTGDGAGGAAVVAVSDLNAYVPVRPTGTSATAANIVVTQGAQVASLGALTIDAPAGAQIADGSLSGAGAHWSLGADNVILGSTGASPAKAFAVDSSLVSALSAASSVRIAGQTSIELDGPITLASSTASSIGEISLITAALNTVSGGSFSSSFNASKIVLAGGAQSVPASGGSGTGSSSVAFTGDEIDVGPGTLALSGFGQTTLQANGAIVGSGTGALLVTSGNVDLASRLLTTADGATTTISAGGQGALLHIDTAPAGSVAPPSLPNPGMGGALTLTAQTISDDANIVMPSGQVSLSASQQLTLQPGASINVAGVTPSYAQGSHGSPGGSVMLQSGGDLAIASGASISVAAAPGADAGRIDLISAGNTTLAGNFSGSSDGTGQGGTFALTAGTLTGFNALNQQLEVGGFTQERDFRVNSGDLDLQAGAAITARHVTLTADSGSVTVDGTIDASAAAERGSISLNAGKNVVVSGTGQLIANGTDPASRGGSIELFSKGGEVDLQQGSRIAAKGAGLTGQLVIRAPLSATNGISANVASSVSGVDSVLVEPIIPISLSSQTLNQSGLAALMASNVAPVMSGVAANILKQPALAAADANVAIRPYVDLYYNQAQGNLSLVGPLDLSSFRYGSQPQPADFAFRSSGGLTVTGTLSDGFKTGGTKTQPTVDLNCPSTGGCPSAGITLVAGADFSAAAPTSVITTSAAGTLPDLDLAAGAIVRTATGDIQLAAARDITIGDPVTNAAASIYTGGVKGGPTVINSGQATAYPFGDSLISLTAGRDITGVQVSQSVTSWQPRTQGTSNNAIWGVDFARFGWGVGALGGGDVYIQAGHDVTNVSAAVADSSLSSSGSRMTSDGGNLLLRSGGDVGSAYLYVADGTGRVQAGGSIGSARQSSSGAPLGSLLISGDASFSLAARGDVLLAGEVQASTIGFPADEKVANGAYFFRYGPGSVLRVASTGGSVTLDEIGSATAFFDKSDQGSIPEAELPPSLDVASYAGNVTLANNAVLTLYPAPRGQATIVAAHDVVSTRQGSLVMSDAAPSSLPTADALLPAVKSGIAAYNLLSGALAVPAGIHQNDPTPALISAGEDISDLSLTLAKAATIQAGRDIVSLGLSGQNMNPSDTTLISAGRNISYSADPASPDFNPTANITVGGPGRLEMLAGGNIDLGFSAGVTTVGNLRNANLPGTGGADIFMLAGMGAPLGVASAGSSAPKDFVNTIIGSSPIYQQQLEGYVEGLTGQANLDFATAASDFRALGEAQQLPLLSGVFFNELVMSGREANADPKVGFSRGYAAIDALFPGSRGAQSPYSGSLTLDLSRIYTLNGGSISLMVPGGGVNVGLSILPPALTQANLVRNPSDLGIVAVQSGNVDIYSLNDVLVNSSHVFTLGGGNIAIWSTLGNIDAGRGSKTSVSAPPPTVSFSSSGALTLDFTNTVSGNGIQTISTGAGGTGGQVDLDAPVGFVNAGDAGISAAGSANIAAEHVLGVDNIQVGGTATGIPPETSGISASLSGASAAASSSTVASNAAVAPPVASTTQQAPLAQTALSWLDVFVEGFGEEVCKASDTECLKRQQSQPKQKQPGT